MNPTLAIDGGDQSLFARVERRLGLWGAAGSFALVAQALSFFLYSHPFWIPIDGRWRNTIAILVKDPWTHTLVEEPQVRHRVLGPLLANLAGLEDGGGFAVWILANTILLALIYLLLRRRDVVPAVAALSVFVIGTTLVVITSQTWFGYPDSLAFLGLALCLWTRSSWLMFVPAAAVLLVDERAAAAFPLVLIWHYMADRADLRMRLLLVRGAGVVFATMAWFVYLSWFTDHFGVGSEVLRAAAGGDYLVENLPWVPLGLFFGLRFAWGIAAIGPSGVSLRPIGGRVTYSLALAVSVVPAILVADISRGAAFAFPAILIVAADRGARAPAATAGLLTAILALNVLTPQFQYVGVPALYLPLPLSLFRALL